MHRTILPNPAHPPFPPDRPTRKLRIRNRIRIARTTRRRRRCRRRRTRTHNSTRPHIPHTRADARRAHTRARPRHIRADADDRLTCHKRIARAHIPVEQSRNPGRRRTTTATTTITTNLPVTKTTRLLADGPIRETGRLVAASLTGTVDGLRAQTWMRGRGERCFAGDCESCGVGCGRCEGVDGLDTVEDVVDFLEDFGRYVEAFVITTIIGGARVTAGRRIRMGRPAIIRARVDGAADVGI